MAGRDTYTYDFLVNGRIVHSGITTDPGRREREHQQRWPSGHLRIVGRAKTEQGAREWEAGKEKTRTPPRK
jgi:hypothetical protein